MNQLKIWIRALRVPFFSATLVPVLVGSAIAFHAGFFSLNMFLLMLMAALCVHAGLNLANDYFDHTSGNDEANTNPTMFSGGSRVIQEKLVTPSEVIIVSSAFFLIAAVLGLYINQAVAGNAFLWIGIAGLLIAFFYTAPPLRLGYHGLGEILTGLGFGMLIIVASYLAQTEKLSLNAMLASIPIAILVALILLVNEFHDYEADKKTKKNNWVVLFGKKSAKNIVILMLVLCFASVLIMMFARIIPYWSFIVFLTLPLGFRAAQVINKQYEKRDELLPVNKMIIGLHLAFGLLFALSFVLDRLL